MMTDEPASNIWDTARFLKLSADMEHDDPEQAPQIETPTDLAPDIRIHPYMSVQQIAALCDKHDCHCRVDVVNGIPHAYLVKNLAADYVPAFLRKQG